MVVCVFQLRSAYHQFVQEGSAQTQVGVRLWREPGVHEFLASLGKYSVSGSVQLYFVSLLWCMCTHCHWVSACVLAITWSVHVYSLSVGQCMCTRYHWVSACVLALSGAVHVYSLSLDWCMCTHYHWVSACVLRVTLLVCEY